MVIYWCKNFVFSCCSVKLDNIIQYYNKYKKLPNVDSSKQYEWYKNKDDINADITFEYFENYNNNEFLKTLYNSCW